MARKCKTDRSPAVDKKWADYDGDDNQISKVAGSVQKYYEVNSVFLSIVD